MTSKLANYPGKYLQVIYVEIDVSVVFYVSLRSWHKHKVTYTGAVNKKFGAKILIQDGGSRGGIQRQDVVLCSSLVLMLMLASYV